MAPASSIADTSLLAAALAAPFIAALVNCTSSRSPSATGMGIIGLKLLSGYNGQFSLRSVFFAIGGYVTAILVVAKVPF